ncbi:uncharacterized protein LOC143414142 [Maylandia zebra]|uniref:uncharacterized protein LOC143414142 n=1 Tax=Maylandia zebra TaxID=106582 RepID=UPI00403D30F8
MDQCEDREEGVPPSKSTLCGEHESQTKAQRNQPGPPPSSVSSKSKRVKHFFRNLGRKKSSDENVNQKPSSSVSLKSDLSNHRDIDFKSQPVSAAERGQRSQSAGSSCPSVRSDRSKHHPPDFSDEPGPTRSETCDDSFTCLCFPG